MIFYAFCSDMKSMKTLDAKLELFHFNLRFLDTASKERYDYLGV